MAAVSIPILFIFAPTKIDKDLIPLPLSSKTFPPTPSDLAKDDKTGEKERHQQEADEEGDSASTGATQPLAATSLSSSPPPKKQRTSSTTANEDEKEWYSIEKPDPSLASSTIDSTKSASEMDPADSVPLGESTVHVDPAEAQIDGGVASAKGNLDDEDEGVKVEKPKELEEEEGVEVERPQNMLGKDW